MLSTELASCTRQRSALIPIAAISGQQTSVALEPSNEASSNPMDLTPGATFLTRFKNSVAFFASVKRGRVRCTSLGNSSLAKSELLAGVNTD